MKNSRQKSVFRIAFCSVIAALETVFMMVAGLFRFGTYALPCFAGILTVAIVIEYGCKWAFGVYAVAAALSFFLSGDKEAVVMFIALFGYYPILKNILERHITKAVPCWIVKLAVFNAAAVGSFFVASILLAVPAEEFTLFDMYVPYVFLIAGNVFFLLYDRTVTVFVKYYVQKLRDVLFRRH